MMTVQVVKQRKRTQRNFLSSSLAIFGVNLHTILTTLSTPYLRQDCFAETEGKAVLEP